MAIRIVYNYQGSLYTEPVPADKTVRQVADYLRSNGAYPIKAVDADTPEEALRLASSSPGSPDELVPYAERPVADQAADMAAKHGISFEDALDVISSGPSEARALYEGKDPGIKEKLSDRLSNLGRTLWGNYAPTGRSREEDWGSTDQPFASPSLAPTAAATALLWGAPLLPALAGETVAQMGTSAALDPDYTIQNAKFAATPPALASILYGASRGAGNVMVRLSESPTAVKAAEAATKWAGQEARKFPFLGSIGATVAEHAAGFGKDLAKLAVKAGSDANSYRVSSPAISSLMEQQIRTDPNMDFTKIPGKPREYVRDKKAKALLWLEDYLKQMREEAEASAAAEAESTAVPESTISK